MKRRVVCSAVLSAVVVCIGCVGCGPAYTAAPARTIEKEKTIAKPFDDVWQSAVEWFATHNMPIKNIDKGSGLISTDYSLSANQVVRYMDCGASAGDLSGETRVERPTGNFNLLLRPLDPGSTRVGVNVFFSCTLSRYNYENLLSTNLVLQSSEHKDCSSTGVLEQEIWTHLQRPLRREVPPAQPQATVASTAPPAVVPTQGQCTSDADCRAGRVCRSGQCTWGSCLKDVDCPAPQVCERSSCVAPPQP